MDSKQKAEFLFQKAFLEINRRSKIKTPILLAKQCAVTYVNFLIKEEKRTNKESDIFWNEVKQHLNQIK